MVYRSRAETEQDFYVGARRDVLRRIAGGWKIADRKVILDQNVLLAKKPNSMHSQGGLLPSSKASEPRSKRWKRK